MPEKRKTRPAVKAKRPTTQTSLKDLFQRSNADKVPDLHDEHTVPAPRATDPQSPAPQPARLPKPSQLFPIFTKVSSVRETHSDSHIDVDDTEVIDITDASSDIELLTDPPLSVRHPSPQSEFSQAASRSPPPSPTTHTHGCESDTSLPHASTQLHTGPHTTSKRKEPRKRTLGLGGVGPLPSSYSQHVRGVQHSYTSVQAPVKRSVYPSRRTSVGGTLDFLRKGRLLDDTPSTPSGHIFRSLTSQQCEEHLQSHRHEYGEIHPVFAQISVHRERTPLYHNETWTRRFRPRRANQVLGNERHALYVRDWLSALELQLRDRSPEETATVGQHKEKGISKRAEPRGVKRPRVIRAVAKKRNNKKRRLDSDDELDDFVVFSDADEEQPDVLPEDSEDEFTFCQRTLVRLRRHDAKDELNISGAETNYTQEPPHRGHFDDNLTNTLLITGPPGCGKTAAVYACAEELGWEVFEVYPGIGKRNGTNLDHFVGEVGRNHIVQTVHRRMPIKATKSETKKELTGLRGYLGKKNVGQLTGIAKLREAGTEGQPAHVEGNSATNGLQRRPPDEHMAWSRDVAISGICHAEIDESRPTVGQSLVLLEEVDILFKEDGGFWTAVVEFIKSCRRPVVMTCNDPGLVPVGELPLQAVLAFEPCPSPVAATFLQCLSLTEGWLVPHEDLMVLYESTQCLEGLETPDAGGYPRTEPLPLPDLRRSISQLQMLCAGAKHGSASEMHQGDEAKGHVRRSGRAISAECRAASMGRTTTEREMWREMKRQSELMSHVDAQLCRSRMAMRETVSTGGEPGGEKEEEEEEEEETGYVMLRTKEGLVDYQQDELIAEEAIQHSRGLHEEVATAPIEASINPAARLTKEDARWFRARVEYQSRMVDALQGIVGPPAPLVPQRSVFLDYIPWVRYMVAVDDMLERRAWEGTGREAGRSTRNSMRARAEARHARTVDVGEGARAMLTGSGLG